LISSLIDPVGENTPKLANGIIRRARGYMPLEAMAKIMQSHTIEPAALTAFAA
jgi:hypothetical protein